MNNTYYIYVLHLTSAANTYDVIKDKVIHNVDTPKHAFYLSI